MLGAALLVMLLAAQSAGAGHGLRTGFLDPGNFSGQTSQRSFARARDAGASIVRIPLVWSVVASTKPLDGADPADPAYRWDTLDEEVIQAREHGLDPLVFISGAPQWARGPAVGLPGTWPSPSAFGDVARAAALRYSGTYADSSDTPDTSVLPRVRFWQAWNEPNAGRELTPQRRNGRPITPAHYRSLVNAFADAVHGVRRSNLVVAGGLAPFGHDSQDIQVVAPLAFMSQLLCVSEKPPYRRTCSNRTRFDIWAHNPYTNGGPNRQAHSPADVSIGDLPEMHALLTAARKLKTIESPQPPAFWVTEISWDTNPPDPLGVPMALQTRWVAEGLYRMWQSGVSAVIWFRLQDDPLRESPYQSGFYTVGGAAKPSLRAFRFPFVAFGKNGAVKVWGRTPTSAAGSVIIEGKSGSRWLKLASVRADSSGIFSHNVSFADGTVLRARLAGSTTVSVPFSLIAPPDRAATSFGCGGPIAC